MRKLLPLCLIVFPFIIAHSQTLTSGCRYFSGGWVESNSNSACWVHMSQITCLENSISFRKRCLNEIAQCISDCSCTIERSSLNIGFKGVIEHYDPCNELFRVKTYECDNCGDPYPTPSPTPSSSPTPTPPLQARRSV